LHVGYANRNVKTDLKYLPTKLNFVVIVELICYYYGLRRIRRTGPSTAGCVRRQRRTATAANNNSSSSSKLTSSTGLANKMAPNLLNPALRTYCSDKAEISSCFSGQVQQNLHMYSLQHCVILSIHIFTYLVFCCG
jgi:hypothetical protein